MHNLLISISDGLTAANSDGHTSYYFVFNIHIFFIIYYFQKWKQICGTTFVTYNIWDCQCQQHKGQRWGLPDAIGVNTIAWWFILRTLSTMLFKQSQAPVTLHHQGDRNKLQCSVWLIKVALPQYQWGIWCPRQTALQKALHKKVNILRAIKKWKYSKL